MAELREGERYGVSCGTGAPNVTVMQVKLTEAALRALESYQRCKVRAGRWLGVPRGPGGGVCRHVGVCAQPPPPPASSCRGVAPAGPEAAGVQVPCLQLPAPGYPPDRVPGCAPWAPGRRSTWWELEGVASSPLRGHPVNFQRRFGSAGGNSRVCRCTVFVTGAFQAAEVLQGAGSR